MVIATFNNFFYVPAVDLRSVKMSASWGKEKDSDRKRKWD